MAEAMRAVLFAKATATTKRGLRPRKAISQGSALAALERSCQSARKFDPILAWGSANIRNNSNYLTG